MDTIQAQGILDKYLLKMEGAEFVLEDAPYTQWKYNSDTGRWDPSVYMQRFDHHGYGLPSPTLRMDPGVTRMLEHGIRVWWSGGALEFTARMPEELARVALVENRLTEQHIGREPESVTGTGGYSGPLTGGIHQPASWTTAERMSRNIYNVGASDSRAQSANTNHDALIIHQPHDVLGASLDVGPNSSATLNVGPVNTPYFFPKFVKFDVWDENGSSVGSPMMFIDSVNIGGAPMLQGGLESGIPFSVFSGPDMVPVNWSAFSCRNLGRELDIRVRNESNILYKIGVCLWGEASTEIHTEILSHYMRRPYHSTSGY